MRYRLTDNSNKSKTKALLKSLPAFVLLLLLAGFLAKAAFTAYMQKRQSELTLSESQAELNKLSERQKFIEGELELFSSQAGREVKLREKFGVGRAGEQVAIIIEGINDPDLVPEEGVFDKVKAFFESLLER